MTYVIMSTKPLVWVLLLVDHSYIAIVGQIPEQHSRDVEPLEELVSRLKWLIQLFSSSEWLKEHGVHSYTFKKLLSKARRGQEERAYICHGVWEWDDEKWHNYTYKNTMPPQ